MNILITGGSGYLGSSLACKLGEMGYSVSLLIRKNTNLYRLANLSHYEIGRVETDQEVNHFISMVCPDVVIHAACCYGRNGESHLQLIDSNIRLGVMILNAIQKLKKKILFINTGTVLPKSVSLYGLTKNQFEELGLYISNNLSKYIQFLNIKLQHMYGPGDDASKFTSHVINACKNNVEALSLTLGEQERDFIYIDDVVDAYVKILENRLKLDGLQKIELGSGVAVRLRDFVETAHKLTNSQTKLLFGEVPYRENDVMRMVANIDTLKNMGWIPKFDLEAGIKKTIEMDFAR